MGLLYIMAATDHAQLKIGITKNVASLHTRIAALGGRNRFDLELSRVYDCKNNFVVEQFLHTLCTEIHDSHIAPSDAFVDGAGGTECFSFSVYEAIVSFLKTFPVAHELQRNDWDRPPTSTTIPSIAAHSRAAARAAVCNSVRKNNDASLAVVMSLLDRLEAHGIKLATSKFIRDRWLIGSLPGGVEITNIHLPNWTVQNLTTTGKPRGEGGSSHVHIQIEGGQQAFFYNVSSLYLLNSKSASTLNTIISRLDAYPVMQIGEHPCGPAFFEHFYPTVVASNANALRDFKESLKTLVTTAIGIACRAGEYRLYHQYYGNDIMAMLHSVLVPTESRFDREWVLGSGEGIDRVGYTSLPILRHSEAHPYSYAVDPSLIEIVDLLNGLLDSLPALEMPLTDDVAYINWLTNKVYTAQQMAV